MSTNQVPEEYRPLSPFAYFGYTILYNIPLIGWIFLVIHAIAATNVNKRNYARSYFVILFLLILIFVVTMLIGASSGIFEAIENAFTKS